VVRHGPSHLGQRGHGLAMSCRWGLALACTLLSATPALGAEATWYQNWDSIRAAAAGIKTIETSFVQTRTLKILTRPMLSRGIMAYRRPNDLRWEYQSPLQTLLVAKGGNIHRLIKHGSTWVADASARLEAMKI